MINFLAIFMIAFFVSKSDISAESLDKDLNCYMAFQNKEKSAFEICLDSAESGFVGSQVLVAEIYLYKNDKDNALFWLERASERGHYESQQRLKNLIQ